MDLLEPRPNPPGVVCAWDPYHIGIEGQHGIQVCSECERPLVAVGLPGAPALLVSGAPVPMRSRIKEVPPLGTAEHERWARGRKIKEVDRRD